jgi:hypothetical protein
MPDAQFNHVLDKGAEILTGLLRSYGKEIEEAYLKAEKQLEIGLSLVIGPAKRAEETHHLTGKINFVTDRVKDSWDAGVAHHTQIEMPLKARAKAATAPGPPYGHPHLRHPGWRASYGSKEDVEPFLTPIPQSWQEMDASVKREGRKRTGHRGRRIIDPEWREPGRSVTPF